MVNLKNLEKRVAKLEKELAALKSKHHEHGETTHHKTSKHHKSSKKHKGTRKKRKVNKYFELMLAAKKAKKPSFVYNGHTYKGTKHPRLGMVYRKG